MSAWCSRLHPPLCKYNCFIGLTHCSVLSSPSKLPQNNFSPLAVCVTSGGCGSGPESVTDGERRKRIAFGIEATRETDGGGEQVQPGGVCSFSVRMLVYSPRPWSWSLGSPIPCQLHKSYHTDVINSCAHLQM